MTTHLMTSETKAACSNWRDGDSWAPNGGLSHVDCDECLASLVPTPEPPGEYQPPLSAAEVLVRLSVVTPPVAEVVTKPEPAKPVPAKRSLMDRVKGKK
jgi:hypothetical protein